MNPSPIRGRLAPSPTGAQHVGNARTYLIAWLSARSQGGEVLLRIEDIDSPRIKPGAAEQALDDLRWLGLDWDGEPVVQAARLLGLSRSGLRYRMLRYGLGATGGGEAPAPHAVRDRRAPARFARHNEPAGHGVPTAPAASWE